MRHLKYILALGAFFVAALAISACGGSSTLKQNQNAVVTVDGQPITLRAYKHWMYVAAKGNSAQSPGSPTIVPNDPPDFNSCISQVRKQIPTLAKTPDTQIKSDCKQLFTSLNNTVLDFLIKTYWYELEAHRLHINLTQAQIQKAFLSAKNQQFKTPSAYQTFLTQTGQTQADITFRVRANKLFTTLSARHAITVTPAKIQAYYQSHLTQFGTPETLDMRMVRTNTEAPALAALHALQSGQSWAKVAKQYSIDPTTKNIGGLLTSVSKGQEESALSNAAFAAPANQIMGPIKGDFGYYVFEVTKINKGTQQTLTQATPLIKELLQSQNQTAEQKAVDAEAGSHWKHLTRCMPLYYMTDCAGPAPKGTTGQTTATPTSTTPATTTAATGASGATVVTVPSTTASTTPTTTPSTTTAPATTTAAATTTAPATTTTTASTPSGGAAASGGGTTKKKSSAGKAKSGGAKSGKSGKAKKK